MKEDSESITRRAEACGQVALPGEPIKNRDGIPVHAAIRLYPGDEEMFGLPLWVVPVYVAVASAYGLLNKTFMTRRDSHGEAWTEVSLGLDRAMFALKQLKRHA